MPMLVVGTPKTFAHSFCKTNWELVSGVSFLLGVWKPSNEGSAIRWSCSKVISDTKPRRVLRSSLLLSVCGSRVTGMNSEGTMKDGKCSCSTARQFESWCFKIDDSKIRATSSLLQASSQSAMRHGEVKDEEVKDAVEEE